MKINIKLLILFIICNALFIFANIPFWQRVQEVSPDTVSTMVHRGFLDYFTYLSFIREGRDGAWSVPALYTTEPTKPATLYVLYILLGKISAVFNLTPVLTYHLFRLLSLELFIFSAYVLGKMFAGENPAFWVILVGIMAVPPLKILGNWLYGTPSGPIIPSGWHEMEPLARMDWIPHHQFGVVLLFASIIFIMSYFKRHNPVTLVLSAISAFACGIVFPAPSLVILIGFPVSAGILCLGRIARRQSSADISVTALIPAASSMLALLFVRNEVSKGFPWSQWTAWDVGLWNSIPNFDRDFIIAGGVLLIFAFPFIIRNLIRARKFSEIFLGVWAVLPYALLPFCGYLQLAKHRLNWIANFMPLSILGIMGLLSLVKQIRHEWVRKVILVILLAGYLFHSYEVSVIFAKNRAEYYTDTRVPSMTVPLYIIDAIKYLAGNTNSYPTVLSDEQYAVMMPAWGKIRVYYGHEVHTKDYFNKMLKVHAFFKGKMSKTEAERFIRDNGIDYIFVSWIEKGMGGDISAYRIPMKIFYQNEGVKIYKIDTDPASSDNSNTIRVND